MVMGDKGMHDMAEMEMPRPDNPLPMMTGTGPFGPIGMGGMFSVVQVRADGARGAHPHPGPYKHPAGTIANEYTAETPPAPHATAPKADTNTLQVRKPSGHAGH